MELNFFQSLLFGFLSGLTDILPVSAQAHKAILLTLFGSESEPALLRLLIHGAVFAALYYSCQDHIRRIRRNQQLARVPKRRRKRPLDPKALMDVRFLKTMAVPAVIGCLFYQMAGRLNGMLNWVALLALVNSVILFLPNLMPTGNKDSRSLTPMESLLMGVGGGIGILPGISSVGGMVSVASVCGTERKYALDMALLVQMMMTVVMILFDVVSLFSGVGKLDISILLGYILAAAAAFGGVYLGVQVMGNLAEKKGFHVFAFHSLAVAFLAFIFYLVV